MPLVRTSILDTDVNERINILTHRLDMLLFGLAIGDNMEAFEDAEERITRIIEISEDIARESGVDVSA